MRSIGIVDVAIVLGETFPELVQQHYGDGSRFGVKISCVYQGKPLGIAHAVYSCGDFVQDDSFIVHLGDNLLQKGVKSYFEKFLANNYDCMILLKEVDDPSRFASQSLARKVIS